MKFTVNTKPLVALSIILLVCDMAYLAFHPAYRNYKRNELQLTERLDKWEGTFKKDYITAINNVASALTNKTTTITPKNPSEQPPPVSKPLDLQLEGYSYFNVNGVSGFSIAGRLVFRVGDSFLGRRILSADRFGAVLSDGGVLRSSLSSLSMQKEKGKTNGSND